MTASAPTKFEQVYQTVRARIESGEYGPGQRLSFRELARELATSDIPVREAVHRLAAEGRVVYTPRQGVVVAQVTRADIQELFLPYAVLEGVITRLAARHISANTLEQLAANVAEQHAAAAAADTGRFAALNLSFHQTIIRHCPAQGLVDTALALLDRTFRLKNPDMFQYAPVRMPDAIAEHEQLIALLDTRPLNLDHIEAFARGHKLRFLLAMVEGELAAEVRRADLSAILAGAAP